jgi:hypothetical protein
MRQKKIELDSIENGKDSLRHAVEHFTHDSRPTDLKYAVLHVCHAVELFLKAVLNEAHPALIFQKPEDASKPIAKTVDFGTLLGRLHAVGVELFDDDRNTLHALRNERNKIEHHKVELDKQQAEEWIGRATRFLNEFAENELGLQFRSVHDAKTFATPSETIFTYEEMLERASESLPEYGPDECNEHQVVSRMPTRDDSVSRPRIRRWQCELPILW